MTITVCALVPTFNRATYVVEAIRSLLSQSRLPDEIIVIDDGSTDDTVTAVGQFGAQVKLISKPNGGKSTALNLGLKATKADYIWVFDDDDVAEPDGLKHLVKGAINAPHAGFVFGDFRKFTDGEDGRVFAAPDFCRRPDEANWTLCFLEQLFTFQPAMLFRRDILLAVGGFNEAFIRSQDYEMVLKVLRVAEASYVPHLIFSQREHSGVRGALKERFDATQSLAKWLKYDQMLFQWVHDAYPLEAYVPSFARDYTPALKRRAALVERACVFAHHGLWDVTLDDLQAASEIEAPADPEELCLAETLPRNEMPWTLLANDGGRTENLKRVAHGTPFGRAIVTALSRPLVWQAKQMLRSGRIRDGVGRLQLLLRVLGPAGFARRAFKSLGLA